MTFVIVMGFHQIIVVMNDVKRHTYIQSSSDLVFKTIFIVHEIVAHFMGTVFIFLRTEIYIDINY